MTPSKVYYTDLHVDPGTSLLQKLERLIRAAGMGEIDFRQKFTALKLPFMWAAAKTLWTTSTWRCSTASAP